MGEDKTPKITFRSKKPLVCPVCGNEFYREEMFTGGGRLIAGKLTLELRRLYEPSKKYGVVNPLLYPVTVCPQCLFASFKEDFTKINAKYIETAKSNTQRRHNNISKIFGKPLDFSLNRTLEHGAASYLLAVEGYSYFDKWASPTIKKAISSLRAAWLFGDLEIANPMQTQFGDVQNFFYKKALFFYNEAIERGQKGLESYDGVRNFGPDTDKNFGYEGLLYLIGYLTNKLSFYEKDIQKRKESLEIGKRVISKMFGSGKASKDKPSDILMMTRDLYDEMSESIKELEDKIAGKSVDTASTNNAES